MNDSKPNSDPELIGAAANALTEYFVGDATMGETLQRVADLTLQAVPQAVFVGITLLVEDKLGTYVFTHPEVPEIDRAQYDTGDGPCLDAFRTGAPVLIPSTATDTQWPAFSRTAADHGIRSTLSLPLSNGHETFGALNLYAEVEDAFSPATIEAAGQFVAQAAFVLANAQAYWDARTLSEGLRAAMEHRATIEQAKGILMARSTMTPDQAIEILKRASQRGNRKLRDIAADVVARAQRAHDDPPPR
jgi:GAF domain-containing protein